MKPHRKLAETTTPDGVRLTLHEHDGDFSIRLNGQALMHSAGAASETLLGELAVGRLSRRANPRLLIGGLGLGFTLKSVLQRVGPRATVRVAELLPDVVEWNREFLSEMNGRLLDDPRVEILIGDVWDVIARSGRDRHDAILLDVDNGPIAMVHRRNARLYARSGLELIAAALKPGGRAAFWSAGQDASFAKRLSEAGFSVQAIPAKFHAFSRRYAYTIFLGDK